MVSILNLDHHGVHCNREFDDYEAIPLARFLLRKELGANNIYSFSDK
jgi:hypothetical protein